MKMQITPIVLLIVGAVTFATAQTPDQFAALEARIATLEKQNLSLKAAIEATTGRTLAEILTSAAPVAAPAPAAVETDPAPAMAQVNKAAIAVELARVQSQIAAAEAAIAAEDKALRVANDPFASKGGVRMSKADREKDRAIKMEAIANMKAREAMLRARME